MCMERRRFSQTMASEWKTAFVVSHKMPWWALLTAVKNYNKSWKTARLFLQDRDQYQDQIFKTKTKTLWSKTKTNTFIFVLEAPRDQDPGLEDYITASDIRSELNQTETLAQNIERRRLQWFGHVKCADKSGLPAKALETMVSGTRTTRGRPKKRWIENIYENIQKRGSNICRAVKCVKDRNHWKTFILQVKTDEPKEAKQELLRPPSYVFIVVKLLAGLHKNYSTDFHKIWRKGKSQRRNGMILMVG